jgi:branched-chain amino acid transport system substrate-binding protein
VAGGAAAASAVVQALRATKGSSDTEKLITAMEGMNFETPKGTMSFRKEDHQAMQPMYHFRIKAKDKQKNEWDLLELVREIPANQLPIPINNKP